MDQNQLSKMQNLAQAELEIVKELKVWPTKPFFKDKRVGDFVFLTKKKRR